MKYLGVSAWENSILENRAERAADMASFRQER